MINSEIQTLINRLGLLRWFRLDEDGERYAGAVITTHFTALRRFSPCLFRTPCTWTLAIRSTWYITPRLVLQTSQLTLLYSSK